MTNPNYTGNAGSSSSGSGDGNGVAVAGVLGGHGSGAGSCCYAHVESISATTEAIYAATAQGRPGPGQRLGSQQSDDPQGRHGAEAMVLLLHVRLHLMRASVDITMRAIIPPTNPTATASGMALAYPSPHILLHLLSSLTPHKHTTATTRSNVSNSTRSFSTHL